MLYTEEMSIANMAATCLGFSNVMAARFVQSGAFWGMAWLLLGKESLELLCKREG